MTNEEYTPSLFDVREIYISAQLRARGLSMGTIDSQLSWELDRFIVEIEAKATAREQERIIKVLTDIAIETANGEIAVMELLSAIENLIGKDND